MKSGTKYCWIHQILEPYSLPVIPVFIAVTYPQFLTADFIFSFSLLSCRVQQLMIGHDDIGPLIYRQIQTKSSFSKKINLLKKNLRIYHNPLRNKQFFLPQHSGWQ